MAPPPRGSAGRPPRYNPIVPSVARVRWAKFRVTVVSAVALTILCVLLYLLTGGTLFEPKARLYLFIPDATGLGPTAPVRVDGIDIGTVDWVRFSGSNDLARIVKVQITIDKSRLDSITADSVAQISNDTLVGDKFVDITTGKAPGHVPENGELHFKPQPDLMRSVDLEAFEKQLRIVDATLADIEAGRTDLGKFVIGDEVYLRLRARMTQLQSGMRRALASNAQIGSLVYTDALYQKIRAPILKIDDSIAQIASGQGAAGRFLNDPAQYQSLRNSLDQLRKGIADARSADLLSSDASYRDWNAAIASIARQVDEVNQSRMLNATDIYESWTGSLREMQATVKDFRQNPQKYLRLKVF